MKVLFVVDSLHDGGAGRVVARLASYFQDKGIITSILPVFDNEVSYSVNPSVTILPTFERPLEHSVKERIKLIRKSAKKLDVDFVISFLSYINLYAIVAGFGERWLTVVSERNNPYTDPRNKKIRSLRKILYLFADGLVFQTEDARDYFSRLIRSKSSIIPNPVADDIIAPFNGERTKRIVSAGRLTKQKNYTLAINAIKKVLDNHPDYYYEIYGQGEEEEHICAQINQLNLASKVFLRGHVSDLLERIKDASVFVLSSDYEGISNSLIEALAIGLPVVSTDHPIGGARLLIKNGENGFLVPVGNECELSDSIEKIITNKELASTFERNAVKVRVVFSISIIGNKWIDFLASMKKRKRNENNNHH